MRGTGPAAVDRPRWSWFVALPWVVAAGLTVAAVARASSPVAADPAARASDAAPPAATAPAMPVERRLDGATTAVVLVASRVALGTHGLDEAAVDGPGTADRWVLDQVLGRAVADGSDTVTVPVHATVIHRTATGWSRPTTATARVRVRLADPPVVLDTDVDPGPGALVASETPAPAATDAAAEGPSARPTDAGVRDPHDHRDTDHDRPEDP